MSDNVQYKIGMISLGCPKNQVDAEIMLASLAQENFVLVDDVYSADIVIVNTCGFIEDAKKEAIENILEMTELKKDGEISAVIVTGCLAQRYKDEILKEIPEVDAVVGLGANSDIAKICRDALEGKKANIIPDISQLCMSGERLLTTPEYWAYLKISDGCSNCCSYCAIPSIRGKFRSRKIEEILEEAKQLADSGVKELVVIAQDTTRYGEDLYGELKLPELLDKLCEIDGIHWIRLLYCYPDRLTDELMDTIAKQPKILNYIDLPLQHADGEVLKRMNRSGNRKTLTELINKLRSKIPDVVIRTTFITGFPGETEENFEQLDEFVQEMKFDRLGCFAYSAEEGTPAASFENQIDDEVKIHRGELIMQKQYDIFVEKNNERIGKTYEVIVDGYDGYTDTYFGRAYMDAPEIDSKIIFTSSSALNEGEFVNVKIIDVEGYDLLGKKI
ncbi:MAG: 30S ribosomal protein S12 methylthiotransferase RimO [Clostridiales bacterium]|nr:30S ribosomal protein S12 methylthiotransferase RimO [Clostridiales bacterium]